MRSAKACLLVFAGLMGQCAFLHAQVVGVPTASPATEASTRPAAPKVAAICTVWRKGSHADVLVTRFLAGFPTEDGLKAPKVQIVSLYIDQSGPDDLGQQVAARYKLPIYKTVREALTLGGDRLAVDAVLFVGEHGDYPVNRYGMKMYPRMRTMAEIFRVFEASGRVVPVFNDKHLAHNWLDAKWVYDRAGELGVPLQAGSSVPLWWRRPALTHPVGSRITEAVALTYGEFDAYGFHGLELLECMLERRKGGETGVVSVQALRGKDFYQAGRDGKFDMNLVEAACAAIEGKRKGKLSDWESDPVAILVNYRDGTRGLVLLSWQYYGLKWGYAAKVDGRTVACEVIATPAPTVPLFTYLGLNIQELFVTGKVQYPLERTLLATGVLDYAHRSLAAGGKVIPTPFLNMTYRPFDFEPLRPQTTQPSQAKTGEPRGN